MMADTALPPSLKFSRIDVIEDIAKARPAGVSVNFGQVVQLKALYLEKREPIEPADSQPAEPKVRRHVDVLATSTIAGSAFTGEGELAYSQLDPVDGSSPRAERPMMLRLAFKSRWDALNYGAEYKSSDAGFVAMTGATTDIHRDDAQIWGERSWGAVKVRAFLSQTWEKPQDAGVTVSRSAAASLNYSHGAWIGSLASTYRLLGAGTAPDQEISVASHTITAFYRPTRSITLGPSFSLTRQWNPSTGARTDTPATALSVVYAPSNESFRLSGTTSFAGSFNTGGTSETGTFRTGAALDCNIGKLLGAADRLSLWVDYDHRPDPSSSGASHGAVRTMLVLKVSGF
jgi:hypothetical protein